jgi:quinoprotein glucose dehydrogenase
MPGPPVLAKIIVDGRHIDAVVQLTKHGYAFVFDRVTGKPVWPITEQPVPASDVPGEKAWPTQPVPSKPPAFTPQGVSLEDAFDLTPELHAEAVDALKKMRTGPLFTPPSTEGTIMRPGTIGGADWSGGAFDPETGMLYVKVNTSPSLIRPRIPDKDGNIVNSGGGGAASMLLRHSIPVLKPPYGLLDAIDLNAGALAWQKPFGDDAELRKNPALQGVSLPAKLGAVGNAGVIVTKGGLLFAGGGDAAFHGVYKKNGEDLWSYPTGGIKTTGTPMTYSVRGRQYVVISIGGAGAESSLLAFAL